MVWIGLPKQRVSVSGTGKLRCCGHLQRRSYEKMLRKLKIMKKSAKADNCCKTSYVDISVHLPL